jgi:hypothetical protein
MCRCGLCAPFSMAVVNFVQHIFSTHFLPSNFWHSIDWDDFDNHGQPRTHTQLMALYSICFSLFVTSTHHCCQLAHKQDVSLNYEMSQSEHVGSAAVRLLQSAATEDRGLFATMRLWGSVLVALTLILYLFLLALSYERRLYLHHMNIIYEAYWNRCRAGDSVQSSAISDAFHAYNRYLYHEESVFISLQQQSSSPTTTTSTVEYRSENQSMVMHELQRIEI